VTGRRAHPVGAGSIPGVAVAGCIGGRVGYRFLPMKKLLIALIVPILIPACAPCGDAVAPASYVCQCGESCTKCKTTSDKPGTCACGKPLVAR